MRLPIALVGLLMCTGCSEERAVDDYFAAHDDRVIEFCRCFGPLNGYRGDEGQYGDIEQNLCIEGERLQDHQRACIASIYEPSDPWKPHSAFQCLAAAENSYASCLGSLSCDDSSGLEACIEAYNEARMECPRLSVADEGTFESCLRA